MTDKSILEVPMAGEPREEELKLKVEQATSFDDLYTVIRNSAGMDGSFWHYSSDQLVNLIEGVRNDGSPIRTITKSCGLRAKVFELMAFEERQKRQDMAA